MRQKVLSISIAAYNVANYLGETLHSLLIDEPYRSKLDIIIVNDGSMDETLGIAKEFAEKYPECIRYIDKSNGGYGSTINTSLPIANGIYYKLLDGDDWVNPQGLIELVKYLEIADADLVVNPYYMITDTKKFVAHHAEIPKEKTDIANIKLRGNFLFQMHGITIRTDVLRSFDHKITEKCFYTDFEFVFYCILASETISRCGSAVYCYRMGQEGQSVSLTGMRKHYQDYYPVAERVFQCYCHHIKNLNGIKKEITESLVAFFTYCMFNVYMLLENPQMHKKELMNFDALIQKKYPYAWKAGMKSRIVKWTRVLHFNFYGIFCRYMMWKLEHGK